MFISEKEGIITVGDCHHANKSLNCMKNNFKCSCFKRVSWRNKLNSMGNILCLLRRNEAVSPNLCVIGA